MKTSFEPSPDEPKGFSLENRRRESLSIAEMHIKERRARMGEIKEVNRFGGDWAIREGEGSVIDTIVAEAQMIYKAADEYHQETIKGGDYHKEQAAAMLANLYKNNEILITNFAEILEHYPEIAERVAKNTPGLSALLQAQIQYKQESSDRKYAANDDRFREAA